MAQPYHPLEVPGHHGKEEGQSVRTGGERRAMKTISGTLRTRTLPSCGYPHKICYFMLSTREMAPSAKCSLPRQGDPASDPQHPTRQPGTPAYTCNPSTERWRQGGGWDSRVGERPLQGMALGPSGDLLVCLSISLTLSPCLLVSSALCFLGSLYQAWLGAGIYFLLLGNLMSLKRCFTG